MNHAYALNVAVNLLVGLSLLFVWRRDSRLSFTRDLGLAYCVQAVFPFVFHALSFGGAWRFPSMFTLLLLSSAYQTFLLSGCIRLVHRHPNGLQMAGMFVVLVAVNATAGLLDPRGAFALAALLHIVAGIMAASRLWRNGVAERLAVLSLMAIGVAQLVFAMHTPLAGADLQATTNSILRLVLGLALIYAAFLRHSGEAELARNRVLQLIENSHQGVAVLRDARLIYGNPALRRIYGLSPSDNIAEAWQRLALSDEDRVASRQRHQRIVRGEMANANWVGQRHRADGTPIRLRFSAWRVDWDDEPAEQVVITDETREHDAMQALLHQALCDQLTGLPNRSALLNRLREDAGLAARPPFALLLLDVDRFTLFNEACGPAVGDEVLKALAVRLRGAVGEHVELARLGEDEFALRVCDPQPAQAASRVVEWVRQALSTPLVLSEHTFFVDVSIGVAIWPDTATHPEQLLRAAHAAMHRAKLLPGTAVEWAKASFIQGSGASLEAEQALREGLRNEEFVLVYQPKVNARTGCLVGFEALVRWDREGVGRISPADFVPAAERTGLIGPLGHLILTLACQQLAEWRLSHRTMVPVAVNVSPLQLLDPRFPDMVMGILRKFSVPASLLALEITESAAVTHMAQAREQIAQMRAFGIVVALDDFGTGFSSLNMLRSLPLHTVKIDRSLIEPMPAPDAVAVVRSICDLASVLSLDVIAEGVETPEQAKAALSAGCEVLQGYLYAPPLNAPQATDWLSRVQAPTEHLQSV